MREVRPELTKVLSTRGRIGQRVKQRRGEAAEGTRVEAVAPRSIESNHGSVFTEVSSNARGHAWTTLKGIKATNQACGMKEPPVHLTSNGLVNSGLNSFEQREL